MNKKWLYGIVAAFLSMFMGIAQAGLINFSWDAADLSYEVNGVLTISDSLNAVSGHDILGITGTVTGAGGGAITGLIANPNQPNSAVLYGFQFDNVLFDAQPLLDTWGILFQTFDGATNAVWNLWGNSTRDYELYSYDVGIDKHGTLTAKPYPNPGQSHSSASPCLPWASEGKPVLLPTPAVIFPSPKQGTQHPVIQV